MNRRKKRRPGSKKYQFLTKAAVAAGIAAASIIVFLAGFYGKEGFLKGVTNRAQKEQAAMKIGADTLETSLMKLGFGQEVPFEIRMAESQFSNTEHIETEIQLADSGYGQGQMLVNPLHMACLYSAFCNEGDMIQPYLVCKDKIKASYWIPQAFSRKTAQTVLEYFWNRTWVVCCFYSRQNYGQANFAY